jgi:glycosyltransferase involved in cell wall biosynthesis
MNILFTRFPLESSFGGAEVQTLSLMEGLRGRGHEVGFLGSCDVLLRKTSELGIGNWELGIGTPPVTKWGAVSFLWRKKIMQKQLIHALHSQFSILNSQVIVMLSLSEKLLLTEWCVKQGMKVFWIEHDKVGRWLSANPWKKMLLRQAKYATTIVVSELSREIYRELGWPAERLIAIGNGIDTKRFSFKTREPRPETHSSMHIGTVARLSKEKGIDLLLTAFAKFSILNSQLSIVGDGPERKNLEKLAHTLGIVDRVRFLGGNIDVGNFYRSLDVFVLPSREHDPCPLAPLEAMACGVPVILTRACGTADYLRNGIDALIVGSGNPNEIARALSEAKNPSFRKNVAAVGQKRVLEDFTAARMVEKYEKLFLGSK